jgi:cytoskeletal protein CcmA (bactofilin family)
MFSKAKRVERNVSMPSIISSDMKVTGDIVATGEMQIDGRVDGDVKCGRLTVGETGTIKGMVHAEQALVRGRIEGHIEAGAVTLAHTAKVKGDVVHETLTIEPGADIEGLCRRVARQPKPDAAAVKWLDIKAAESKLADVKPAPIRPPEPKTLDLKPSDVRLTPVKPDNKSSDVKSDEPKLGFGLGSALPKPV